MSSQVEEIKSRIDMVELIGSYLRLQKAGANFKALCPFHNERTPSFNVSPARQIWHCFGCGKGGDAFSFIQEIEGMDFPAALETLAERAGVELRHEDFKERSERARMYALLEEAAKFFEEQLRDREALSEISLTPSRTRSELNSATARPHLEISSEASRSPLAYLKSRGLTDETIKEFRLGYAPEEWRGLCDFLVSRNFKREEIARAGLAVSQQNTFYDRFRGRIIFPIFDYAGKVTGFGGRIYPEKANESKYVNSPETTLYQKGRTLYGLNRAKSEILKKSECVLVEGYMDAIMSCQAGVKNVVAVSGTALTSDQLKILKRLTDKLIVSFDMDSAGEGAAKRGIALALEEGFDVRVAGDLDGLKDPAEAVAKDKAIWTGALESSRHIVKFYMDSALAKFQPQTAEAKRLFEKSVIPMVALFPELERAHWVREISSVLNIKEEAVWMALHKSQITNNKLQTNEEKSINLTPKTRKELLEEKVLGILANFPALTEKLDPALKSILSLEKRTAFFAELFLNGISEAEAELLGCQRELKKEYLKERMTFLTSKIGEAEKKQNPELPNLLLEYQKVIKDFKEI